MRGSTARLGRGRSPPAPPKKKPPAMEVSFAAPCHSFDDHLSAGVAGKSARGA